MKYIPYGKQWIDREDIKAVIKVLRSDFITQGPKIREFEAALASYCGAKYAVVVSNGTAALHLACLAAGIKKGDEVITTPLSFAASANCVLYCQAKPRFADIDPATLNINASLAEKAITKKTRAIIPVDFAGLPCDYEKLNKLAKKNRLIIIEDACHALGARYRIRNKWFKVGCCQHADMTVFSFHPVKGITCGEGGAVLTNNKVFYQKLLKLRTHGITRRADQLKENHGNWYYEMQDLGFNYRLTDLQCALGLSQLKKLEKFISLRNKIAGKYEKAFMSSPGLIIPKASEDRKSAWHIYAIRFNPANVCQSRREIFDKLQEYGIGVNVHYIPVYLHPYYRKLGYKPGLCPQAEEYYKEAITLPLFPRMTNEQIKRVIKAVKTVIS